MDCVPAGLKLVGISRNDPAPEMVRLQANRRLKLVGLKDLAFTGEEFGDVIKLLSQYRLLDNKVKFLAYAYFGNSNVPVFLTQP